MALTLKEFKKNVMAVVDRLLEKDKNLSEETSRYWDEISSRTYRFDRAKEEASAVRSCTKSGMLSFLDLHLLPGGAGRRKLSVWVHGNQHPVDEVEEAHSGVVGAVEKVEETGDVVVHVGNYAEFKRSMPLYPLHTPPKVVVVGSSEG
ncbi:unnamed protein product [Choristocarpus tenellus]